MSDDVAAPVEQKAPETSEPSAPTPAVDASDAAPAADAKADDAQAPATEKEDKPATASEPKNAADEKPAADADVDMKDASESAEKPSEPAEKSEESKPEAQPDAEHKPSEEHGSSAAAAVAEDKPATEEGTADMADGDSTAVPAAESTPASKNRRKSAVASTGKKLNKKKSMAKILHLDAKPGDHFFARLKGFPPWPVIVCDEEMLPQNMINSRPVTAARPDGTYRDDYADGGKKAADRTYPVMYLQTNEFSWTRNTDLDDLDPDVVVDLVTPKMRKDLAAAHHLAKEQNNIEHYKQVLFDFQEAKIAEAEAKAARARAKKEKTTKKSEPKATEDDDTEMPDADVQEGEESDGSKATKKRKAEDEGATPQRSESVKKPKIKLTTSATPKTATNGAQSPKEAATKATKAKSKSSKPAKEAAKETDGEKTKKEAAPKEPELTPEEKHQRKEKEILFLRHRLQKGLLNKDAQIKESDMPNMSEYLGKLEAFPDLEANIIRVTKINKVLKAMLKLGEIPKEAEFNFKPRSQALLEKWNKILATEQPQEAAPANGVNGTSGDSKEIKEVTNGVNGVGIGESSKEATKEEKSGEKDETKETLKTEEKAGSPPAGEKPTEETASGEPSTVESAA
ncbi:hypothetical protein BKA67DRAFT_664274 [Truncatella angustata]|uniref:PWWP domain-containing protein n=1 Tax=Truncatella angustata TaxID=152316 RepID=A0A9P8RNG0_9PEZI|nr:uncharacterized protein BKA67DRAFT_664274 [Truncatella angustata]KAH6646435.1 hypothetical protein BKA67DRAFT_664274 [Truncatella angustata]